MTKLNPRSLMLALAGLAVPCLAQTSLSLVGSPDSDADASVIALSDGGFGLVYSQADPLSGQTDFVVARYDAARTLQWARRVGTTTFAERPSALLELPSGDLVAIGSTFPFGANNRTILAAALSSTGALLWANRYSGNSIEAPAAAVTLDGTIVIVSSYETESFKQLAQVMRIADDGTQIFNKAFQMLKDDRPETVRLFDVDVTGGGLIAAAGSISAESALGFRTDPFLITVLPPGLWESSKAWFGPANEIDGDQREVLTGIRWRSNGSYHVMGDIDELGTFAGRILNAEVSADLDPVNAFVHGVFGANLNTSPRSLEEDPDGFFVAAGSKPFGDGGNQMFVWRTLPDGLPVWRTGINGPGSFTQGLDIVPTNDLSGNPSYVAVGLSIASFLDPVDILWTELDSLGRNNCSDEELFGFAGSALFTPASLVPERELSLPEEIAWSVTATPAVPSWTLFCESGTCPADFDGSGFVDSDDFVFFIDQFTRGCTAPGEGAFGPDPLCIKSADFDNTGFVDSDDFVAFIEAFSLGC